MTAYLERSAPKYSAEQRASAKKLLEKAKAKHQDARVEMPSNEHADWFEVSSGGSKRPIRSLYGDWSHDVDASKTWIEVQGEIRPLRVYDTEILLESGESDVLAMQVTHEYWGFHSKIIVVTNGSFLLNVPLVNHEHRKLAVNLIEACGEPGSVAFLESDQSGVPVYNEEPTGDAPSWEAMATVWPFGPILIQCAVLGIIVCFAAAPIFGTAREERASGKSDFGKHIDALGRMLSRTQNRNYAQTRLSHYQDKVRRDSGVAHGEGRKVTRQLTVEIRFEGTTFATPEEVAARHQFETQVVQRGIGKIVESTSGLGKLEITIEVENEPIARQALQSIIRQLNLSFRASINSDKQK